MLCRDAEDLLAPYADDALPPIQSAAVASHLGGCRACRREFEELQRSLRAINAAATSTSPDLWSRFQSQLGARSIAGDRLLACDGVRSHLAELVEGTLDAPRSAAIREHLANCASCASEEAVHIRSLASLNAAGATIRNSRTPDLWSATAARLSDTLPCRAARALLPVWVDRAVTGSAGSQLTLHLAHCAECAAEAEMMRRAVGILDRVGAQPPAVDLWPAFAQLLRADEERASNRPLIAVQRWAASLWTGGLTPQRWAPVLAVPIAALAMLGLRLWTAQEPQGRTLVTVAQSAPSSAPEAQLPDRDRLPNTKAVTPPLERTTDRPRIRVIRSGPSARRVRRHRTRSIKIRRPTMLVSLPPRSVNPEIRPKDNESAESRERNPSIRLAASDGSGQIEAPVEVNSRAARDQVMPEFVQAVTLLVGAETATTHPFEINVNAY